MIEAWENQRHASAIWWIDHPWQLCAFYGTILLAFAIEPCIKLVRAAIASLRKR